MNIAIRLAAGIPSAVDPMTLLSRLKRGLTDSQRFKRISLKKTVPDDHRVLEVRVEEFTHAKFGESYNVTLTLRADGEDPEESWSMLLQGDFTRRVGRRISHLSRLDLLGPHEGRGEGNGGL